MLRGADPVLHLHELALQAEELAEVVPAIGLRRLVARRGPGRARVEDAIVDFELELLVEAVDEVVLDTLVERVVDFGPFGVHGR
jgi:hypothetical protein